MSRRLDCVASSQVQSVMVHVSKEVLNLCSILLSSILNARDVCARAGAGTHPTTPGGRSGGVAGAGEVGATCGAGCAGGLAQRAWETAAARADERHDYRAAPTRTRHGGAFREPTPPIVPASHTGSERASAQALPAWLGAWRFRARAARALGRRGAALGELARAPQGDVAGAVCRVAGARSLRREARLPVGRRGVREGGAYFSGLELLRRR